jgi:exodeoxyribonuclease VII small subunit
MPTKKASTEPTFETSLEELETIVRRMENGDLSLDESLDLFERGRVEMLVKGAGGTLEPVPFADDDDSDDVSI